MDIAKAMKSTRSDELLAACYEAVACGMEAEDIQCLYNKYFTVAAQEAATKRRAAEVRVVNVIRLVNVIRAWHVWRRLTPRERMLVRYLRSGGVIE